jgi:nitroreductase
MEFFEVIKNRRSMRKYANTPVEEGKLQEILEAINRAPSAGNLQAYEVYIVRKSEQRQALSKAALDQEFLAEAPLVLIFCANPMRSVERYAERGMELYCIQDATIACTFAMLAAKALGLDTVWIGAFNEQAVSEILLLPEILRPIAMLPIGYAGKTPNPRPRRSLKDLIHEM